MNPFQVATLDANFIMVKGSACPLTLALRLTQP
jgi:hypothetical protein